MPPKIAIVTDWLTVCGGAEEVIKRFFKLYPKAELFTTAYTHETPKKLGFENKVHSSFLQKLPQLLIHKHPFLLPFLPKAIEMLDVSAFDVIISSSSFVGKGVITQPNQIHICYCHTPTRYLWGDWQQYLADFPLPSFLKVLLPRFFTKLRIWDAFAATRPNHYVANSSFIRAAINKYYRREAEVIHPPVNTERFTCGLHQKKGDFYLALGRLVPQKKFDLLIRAFLKMPDKKLKIVGTGRKMKYLIMLAGNAQNIEFTGFLADEYVPALLGQAKALLFPQLEDAGITAIEALAAGTPVIAYGEGGAKEMLENGKTGLFFDEQTPQSIRNAIANFEAKEKTFKRTELAAYAEKFSIKRFDKEFGDFVNDKWREFEAGRK